MKMIVGAFVLVAGLAGQAAFARAQTTAAPADRANTVRQLSNELRWHDAEGHKQYLRIRDERTKRFLNEIDGFVAESFSPGTATAEQVKTGLDALLSHKKGDSGDNVAFLVNLPNGHFLVIGVDVRRGGGAISEDAMSFRAYREEGHQFVLTADVDYPYSGDNDEEGFQPFAGLHAKALLSRPRGGEFWFTAWAQLGSVAPPIVTMRLFGFDGEKFRTVWSTDHFFSAYVDRAVQLTPDGGFTLRTMPDPKGNIVINERYAVTADGPQKVADWETELR
jgi:hypothetical protein